MRKTRFGWLELFVGIAMIILGIYTLVRPNAMLTGMVAVYGIMAIISGARDIVFCCRTERFTGFLPAVSMVSGILSVMAGIMLLAYPNAGKWIVAMLIPIWFLTHSIFQLASVSMLRDLTSSFHFYVSLATGIIGLIFGILLLLHPMISVLTVGVIIGLYLILTGINSIIVAFSKTGFYM